MKDEPQNHDAGEARQEGLASELDELELSDVELGVISEMTPIAALYSKDDENEYSGYPRSSLLPPVAALAVLRSDRRCTAFFGAESFTRDLLSL